MATWPNLFVVGAEKAGTTSLHRMLGSHPEVATCTPKEPHFFSYQWRRHHGSAAWPATQAAYQALFADMDTSWRCDASVSYLVHAEAAQRIHDTCPDARIIISLRDPVGRAHSHYLMQRRKGLEDASERDAVLEDLRRVEAGRRGKGYAMRGWYSRLLPAYLERFGAERVLVLFFEDLRDDEAGTMERVARFLDVDPEPLVGATGGPPQNPYRAARNAWAHRIFTARGLRRASRRVLPLRVRRFIGERILLKRQAKPPMAAEARDALRSFFAEEPEALERLIGEPADAIRRRWRHL